MGGSESSFKRNYEETVSQLSSVQLREITTHFHEVYAKAGGSKGHLVDREAFSKYFKLPVPVGERLFEAFDAHKNGKISFEEFVCGLAVLLHGSFSSKCQLLFQVFNIHGDEGISREELATMLHAILQSTNTIVMAVSQMGGGAGGGASGSAVMEGENREQAIRSMVDSAFRNCDITGTGKLLPLEFEYWVKRHPQILDTLLSFQPRESRGTLGPLLLSPGEDSLTSDPTVSVPLHPSPIPPLPPLTSSLYPIPPLTSSLYPIPPLTSSLYPIPPLTSSLYPIPPLTSSLYPIPPFTSSLSPLPPLTANTQGSLEVTHSSHMRVVQSEPVLTAMATDKQPPPPTRPVEVTTKTPANTLVTMETAIVSTDPVAIEIGASSPTLVLEPDSPLQTGMETSQVKFITGDGEEEELEGVVSSNEMGVVSSDYLGVVKNREEEVEGETCEGEYGEPKVVTGVPDEQRMEGEGEKGRGGDEEGGEVERGEMEEGQEGEIEGNGEGGEMQGGSIMQSQETITDIDFDLPDAPPPSNSSTPLSPLLPTTMEMVVLGTQVEEAKGEIEEPLQLPEEMSSVGGTPLQLSEPQPGTEEELNTVGRHQLERGGHHLELQGDGAHLLDVREGGVGPPSGPAHLPGAEISLPPAALPTHLSDPLSPHLTPSHPHREEGESEELQTLGRGGGDRDVGPELQVLSSPYPPEEEEGVREALYSAWIPSVGTPQVLSRAVPVDQTHLTCPGLVADIKMHDPVAELLMTHYPSESRKTLPSVESVPMDTVGLQRLVKEECYHAALDLTGRFLSAHGQGLGQAGQPSLHTHKTLQMWAARLALLVAMQQYREAEVEMEAFGDLSNPDLYYQYHTHNYPEKSGSMVPFSMRLLHAQLPSLTGNHNLSLDRLCQLQHTCQEVLSEVRKGYIPFYSEPLTLEDQQVAESLWLERLTRVKFSLANTLVAIQDYLLAIEVYQSLLDHLPSLRGQLQSVMGRLYLSLGDLPSAQALFSLAATSSGEEEEGEGERGSTGVRAHINQGLVNVFLGRWQLAKDSFESALQLEPTNLTLRNNVAVCTFYQGHLKECISEVEGVVRGAPPSSLQPALLANLTAAYDLESSSAHSKKLSFLPLLGQHVGEGFPLNSLGLR